VWLAVAPLFLWALVRLFGLDGATPIAFLMAFTPQAAVAALLVAGIAVALRNWAAALVATLAMAVLAAAVLPRAFGDGDTPPAGSTQVDVLSANVYFGGADAAALMALIEERNPDVVAVQELTPSFARELRAAGIDRRLPYSRLAVQPAVDGGGRGIYARWPLTPNPERLVAAQLELPGGETVRIFNVHPRTPRPGGTGRWRDSLRRLPAATPGPPWILLGDFNATLDHAAMREVLDRGYRDAAAATGAGLVFTWPAGKIVPPQVTIDHVLAGDGIGIAGYGVEDLAGSDHRAIWASLFLAVSQVSPPS